MADMPYTVEIIPGHDGMVEVAFARPDSEKVDCFTFGPFDGAVLQDNILELRLMLKHVGVRG